VDVAASQTASMSYQNLVYNINLWPMQTRESFWGRPLQSPLSCCVVFCFYFLVLSHELNSKNLGPTIKFQKSNAFHLWKLQIVLIRSCWYRICEKNFHRSFVASVGQPSLVLNFLLFGPQKCLFTNAPQFFLFALFTCWVSGLLSWCVPFCGL